MNPLRTLLLAVAAAIALVGPAAASTPVSDAEIRAMLGGSCPHCDSCKTVNDSFFECLHRGHADPCDPQRCIENILSSASCRKYPGEAPDRCDTKPVSPVTFEIRQIGRTHSCASNVDWHVWRVLEQGCTTCEGGSIYRVRCDTQTCTGQPFEPDSFVGMKHQCGC